MTTAITIPDSLNRITQARHHAPHSVLGRHETEHETIIRVFLPLAHSVMLEPLQLPLQRIEDTDIFEWSGQADIPQHYKICWTDQQQQQHRLYDPYSFEAMIPDYDMHLFGEGKHWHIHKYLGANPCSIDGIHGILFATWAPNAQRISVVGNFNQWDGRCHPMQVRGNGGIWELFIPEFSIGEIYKFEISNRYTGDVFLKNDPYAKQYELRPNNAAIVCDKSTYTWGDADWQSQRSRFDWQHKPMSIYELHLGSWRKPKDSLQEFLNYKELAYQVVDYIKQLGFTHIELMPMTEHPLDASWGYQTLGYYAPTSRHGTPDDFRFFVDLCHQNNIGVLLDWVPAHFPTDAHGLARFDGTALYEHADPRLGEHRDWGTYIYNYGRGEVKNFLIASALYWLEEYHIDGLRVDAVASMLYLDYSREAHDWIPNQYGGNENIAAIDFLRELNTVTQTYQPGTLMMAEESTAWPQVSRPTWLGGLGFNMKWNMGWMHDTLVYMSKDPIHRQHHHDQLTFGLLYTFTENFILPFSHDEVVHGKQSMRHKMPGDEWQQFANLRLLYLYMYAYPGKKLLFMGNEFGQGPEWDHESGLDWYTLEYPLHRGLQTLVSDLNQLYLHESALHQYEFDHKGFEWIDCQDTQQSVLTFLRKADDEHCVIVLNFTPMVREHYRIAVPKSGQYQPLMNTDAAHYGGSHVVNETTLSSENVPWQNMQQSIVTKLPPLAGIIFRYTGEVSQNETK